MSAVPTPEAAVELRALFDGNPVIDRVEAQLRAAGITRVRAAAAQLPVPPDGELTVREFRAVLARFTPEPADRCVRCGGAIEYVADGPDPGWWRHSDTKARPMPHAAVPDHRGGDR